MIGTYFNKENSRHTLSGLLFVAGFATLATFISFIPSVKGLGFSPLIIGIVISMIYGNTLRKNLPQKWLLGILFSAKFILRLALIFYGFRITFQEISSVGTDGLIVSVVMVLSTFLLGTLLGSKVFKMDSDLAMLTSSGASICGAAAVLATESVLRSEPHKSAIAVSTVVLFGTISMFVYPALYQSGILEMSPESFGVYIGGSIHEVAQVVAAGNAISDVSADTGIIVKMTRVMLLAPLLLGLGFFLMKKKNTARTSGKKLFIPYFVFGFIAVAAFNSFDLLPVKSIETINVIDTFLLTMAMCALGMETNFAKFKAVGTGPVILAGILFIWLLGGGYLVSKAVTYLF